MKLRRSVIRLLGYSVIGLLTIPLLWNLFRPGFYSSHDGEWMVIRLTAFHESFRVGQIPVRWMSRLNHEYGYPVTNFLYPLPFYLAEPFYVLTGDPVTAVKIIMGLSVISMAIGSFLLFRRWGMIAGITGALTYIYSPYVAYNLYARGSLGELTALGIIPWIFWALSSKRFILSSILIAGLITAHNVVALLFFPLIVFYSTYKLIVKQYLFTAYCLLFTLTLALSAFFWLPALAEYRFVRASQIAVADFGNEYLSLQNAFQRTGLVSVLTNLGLPLFFLTENSKWFWDLLKPFQIIQFPWRLLSLFAFSSAVIVSFIFNRLSQLKPFYLSICLPRSHALRLRGCKPRIVVSVLLGLFVYLSIIFISVFPFLSPKSFFENYPSYYQTNDDSTTVRSEYTPVWVKDSPLNRSETPVKHYYPGLKLFVNGIEQPVNSKSDNGELRPFDSADNNRVEFIWSETPLRLAADLVSVAGLLIALFLFKRQQYKY